MRWRILSCCAFLAACGADPLPPAVVAIGPELVAPCPAHALEGPTVRDIAILAKRREISIADCNRRLGEIRAIVAEHNAAARGEAGPR